MKMNHLHIAVPDVQKAQRFYEEYFGFRLAFPHGEGVFLRGEGEFLLAIDPLKQGEIVNFPDWYHVGFTVENAEKVKALYERMRADGVEFAREYKEFGDAAANFYGWSPGPFKLEVTWNRDDEY